MGVESTIPLVMKSITAPEAVIPVHQARSREEFLSPDLNFTVWSPTALSSQTASRLEGTSFHVGTFRV